MEKTTPATSEPLETEPVAVDADSPLGAGTIPARNPLENIPGVNDTALAGMQPYSENAVPVAETSSGFSLLAVDSVVSAETSPVANSFSAVVQPEASADPVSPPDVPASTASPQPMSFETKAVSVPEQEPVSEPEIFSFSIPDPTISETVAASDVTEVSVPVPNETPAIPDLEQASSVSPDPISEKTEAEQESPETPVFTSTLPEPMSGDEPLPESPVPARADETAASNTPSPDLAKSVEKIPATAETWTAAPTFTEPIPSAESVVNNEPMSEPAFAAASGFTQTEPEEPSPVVSESESSPSKEEAKPSPDAAETASSYDPIAVNGEFFVDWPKPKLLIVFTGFMNGYVEPCGCAGMEQMKGGLSRRHAFIKELEAKGWPVLPIDAGNLNKGFGRQEELKYNFVIDESLRLMKYGAAGIGNRELLLPTDTLINYTVDVPGNPKRYTSANVAILEFNPEFVKPFRVLEKNGLRVGVVSVIAPSFLKEVNNQEIVHDDPLDRLRAVLPELDASRCDRRVLIVHGTTIEIDRILKAFPGRFDFVLGSDTPAEPPPRPNRVEGAMLIEVGEKGKFAVAIGLYDDKETPMRYQRVALDSRYANSPSVIAMMRLYQDQLKKMGLSGLGIKPIPDRRSRESGKYVGTKACVDCHEPSYAVWRKSKHAAAWRSLAVTSNPPRTYDPECIACHVVGWNPAEFLPYENGYLSEKETPQLIDVGCESCHGPGEKHSKAELGSDAVLQERLRAAVRLPLEGNAAKKLCIECHDGDNSPHFDFDVYWPKIVHVESEE